MSSNLTFQMRATFCNPCRPGSRVRDGFNFSDLFFGLKNRLFVNKKSSRGRWMTSMRFSFNFQPFRAFEGIFGNFFGKKCRFWDFFNSFRSCLGRFWELFSGLKGPYLFAYSFLILGNWPQKFTFWGKIKKTERLIG